jgi:ATP-dependent DNA helicase RecQ
LSPGLDEARRRLREVFGFQGFRPGQEAIVAAALAGRDLLAVMPTGSGKSLCYQLPAVVGPGLTLVVSPLIALMRDQVTQLRALGIEAACLSSGNSAGENREAMEAALSRRLRLLYVAPERLAIEGVLADLRRVGITRMVVDEAHCVSQWGHDFRPDYLGLGAARDALGATQTLAFTATADATTRADIAARLFPAPPEVVVHGFDRPNIRLAMAAKQGKAGQITRFVDRHRGESGIVYCASRRGAEEIAADLVAAGHKALPYHAGLEKEARARNQDVFQQEDGVVIAATVAFGMGIDKPDVRFVAHADMPASIEAYYQEIGRAGRDGLPADTLTLYGLADIALRRRQIAESESSEERKRTETRRLDALIALCEAPLCRRQTLLRYFGQEPDRCGRCDLCEGGVATVDGTTEARKLLSAIARTGERFGAKHLVDVLVGNRTENVAKYGHDALPTFGVGADLPGDSWRSVLRQLYAVGLVDLDIAGHGRIAITPQGREALFGRRSVTLRAFAPAPARDRRKARKEAVPTAAADGPLLDRLRALRMRFAKAMGVPAYVVFPDRTLIEMASRRPATLDELSAIHGVGRAKLGRFGEAFIAAITGGRGGAEV